MKDIIDFIATKHEGVKSPVLRAGDFAVWYNPNQTMIQSGSLVDTNVYNLATQVAEDAATELILEVSGTKLAALSGGAAMQGGAEAGSVGLAAIMWWFRNRRAAAKELTEVTARVLKNKVFVRSTEGAIDAVVKGDGLWIDMYQVFNGFGGNAFGTRLIEQAIKASGKAIKSVQGKLGGTNLTVFEKTGDIWQTPIGKSMKELGFKNVHLNGTEFYFF
jgi:hypothetical protein